MLRVIEPKGIHATGWVVSVQLVKDLLTIDEILTVTCNTLEIRRSLMACKNRTRPLPDARKVYAYFCVHLTTASDEEIGMLINKNHATIHHAYTVAERLLDVNDKYMTNCINIVSKPLQSLQYEKLQ